MQIDRCTPVSLSLSLSVLCIVTEKHYYSRGERGEEGRGVERRGERRGEERKVEEKIWEWVREGRGGI